jgi:Transposase domain (DUF772)
VLPPSGPLRDGLERGADPGELLGGGPQAAREIRVLGERSSRVIEKRCVRDVAYRVICGGLFPDHATIARFRARHQEALRGLFSQVLRLLAAEGKGPSRGQMP